MKEISEELKYKLCKSHAGLEKVSWGMIFDTEQELIDAMFHKNVHTDGVPYYKLCRGYEYIKSFKRYYKRHNTLTQKQLVQLKRLASEIAYHIYCETE